MDALTSCIVSRRARTQPDTGDIEGLNVLIDDRQIPIVVECKNTLPIVYGKDGKPKRDKKGRIVYKNDFSSQWAETVAEAGNKATMSGCPATIGILAKKMPGIGMKMPGIEHQPVVMTQADAEMIGFDTHWPEVYSGEKRMWTALKYMASHSTGRLECWLWYWRGRNHLPLAVTSLKCFCTAVDSFDQGTWIPM